jgi:pyruvate,water dikinase
MVQSFTEDFAVTWTDPTLAQRTFIYDPMHFPRVMVPFAAEFLTRMYRDFMSSETILVNGYAFSSPPTPRPPTPAILERGVLDVWTKDLLPPIEATVRAVRGADYDHMDLAALGDAVAKALADSVAAFGNTMIPITGFMGPTFGLVAFLEETLGEEGPQLAAALLQGQENGTAAAGTGLSTLVDAAKAHPAVADALRAGRFDAVRQVEGGAEFGAALDGYLAEFGWRVESWGQMDLPTWSEDPRPLLSLVTRYLDDAAGGPGGAIGRAGEQRAAALERIESRLNADQLQQFHALMEAASSHVPVSEGRALWQLITVGSLRVPVLALGRELVAAGALADPSDALFLDSAELRAAAHAPSATTKDLVAGRRADHARWEQLTPPPFIGAPLDLAALPPEMVPLVKLFFGAAPPVVEGREIKGQGASRGVVTGRARVIRDLADSGRLERGEILVCVTTSPPWTPLFAIAGAVVTDSGGVLSHSAICAREYGIPCVVATQVATHMIQDGALITVDGAAGVVRIEA